MAEVQWIKIYIDMFDKRKIKKLRRLPAGNELLLIWIMLLATAGKCNAGGMIYITENVPFTEEDLADELDFEVGTIRLALRAFEELDMITTTAEGYISIMNWEEYQNVDRLTKIREYNRLAKQRQRERQKLLQSSVNDMSMTSQRCQDIEEDIEEDKEKDIHSIYLSGEEKQQKSLLGTLGEGVVVMSDEQFEDLCKRLSRHEIEHYFGVVVECEKSGKHFKKPHYQAILEMAEKDRKLI